MEYNVEIVGKTVPLIEGITSISDFLMYMAKVSNPEGQFTKTNLLDFLMRNNHWSPLEMATIQIEIECPRDISRQILRHTSARFQEFSQRYAKVKNYTVREVRRQDPKNRQNSIDDMPPKDKREFEEDCRNIIAITDQMYSKWLDRGAAKECARVFLPEGLTMSRLYMSAPIRTWVHYLDLREGNGTQKEHQIIATEIRRQVIELEPELLGGYKDGRSS